MQKPGARTKGAETGAQVLPIPQSGEASTGATPHFVDATQPACQSRELPALGRRLSHVDHACLLLSARLSSRHPASSMQDRQELPATATMPRHHIHPLAPLHPLKLELPKLIWLLCWLIKPGCQESIEMPHMLGRRLHSLHTEVASASVYGRARPPYPTHVAPRKTPPLCPRFPPHAPHTSLAQPPGQLSGELP